MSRSRTQRVSRIRISVLGMLLLGMVLPLFGQRPSAPDTLVPPFVSFSGSLTDGNGKALSGVVGVTFALYKESQGGAPLWLETQNVTADRTGHYSVQLGSTSASGLPPDLFQTGEERWLGVQVSGEPEQARILLVSVPYAIKAGDAATVGGLPASAFALAGQQSVSKSSSAPANAGNAVVPAAAASVGGSGTTGYVPRWTGSTSLGNSVLFQTGAGLIGAGTTAPAAKVDATGGTNVGLRGTTTGANAGAVWGDATSASGVTVGVRGTSASTTGTGVSGNATATSGANTGVAGHSSSSAGTGALGSADASHGSTIGILGRAASSSGTAGVFNNTAGGKEISAQAKGVENFSVDGQGNVTGTTATFTATGTTAAVTASGDTQPENGYAGDGVDAFGADTSATGEPGGIGVKVLGGDGYSGNAGVMATGGQGYDSGGGGGAGISATGGVGVGGSGDGIDAFAGPAPGPGVPPGLAGSFSGDVTITGSLSVSGTKHFKIDDPVDPANKYLYHAALESSEVLDL
jgi:trimeric autotransporter adhesin